MLGITFVHVFLSALATQGLGKYILSVVEEHGHYPLG
jgi:Na+-transporting methylmalonyl-CoA/oxaloacetate decarboxylase gamma subunit